MNSYVGMIMVKKEQGQDDYFNQQSILLTLPAYSVIPTLLFISLKCFFITCNNLVFQALALL